MSGDLLKVRPDAETHPGCGRGATLDLPRRIRDEEEEENLKLGASAPPESWCVERRETVLTSEWTLLHPAALVSHRRTLLGYPCARSQVVDPGEERLRNV